MRFKVNRKAEGWTVFRTEAKNPKGDKWAVDSYHSTLAACLAYLMDRMVAEGYSPKGLNSLRKQVVEAEARVRSFGEQIEAGLDPEITAL